MEYHEETIICPKCGKVQVAKVEHTAPFYSYVHECEKCGYTILESEWEHPNDHEGLDESAEEYLDATIIAMWELYSKPIDAGVTIDGCVTAIANEGGWTSTMTGRMKSSPSSIMTKR